MKIQGLRELRKITQWKDNCVYRTEYAGHVWMDIDYVNKDKDLIYCSVSSNYTGKTIRSVSDNTPAVINLIET